MPLIKKILCWCIKFTTRGGNRGTDTHTYTSNKHTCTVGIYLEFDNGQEMSIGKIG